MKKNLTVTAGILAVAAMMFTAAPAMARVDVDLNIGVPGPVYYAQPQPVYVQPHPVYYTQPRPYYVDRHHHKHYRKHYRHDNDRDGVPNRYDRRPNNPHRH